MNSQVTVLVCGGGNGAHTLAGLASSYPNTQVRVLTLFEDEAERWNDEMRDGFTVHLSEKGRHKSEVHAKSFLVTKDPSVAVKGCDVIAMVVPAYAHELFLKALKPHVSPGTIMVGLPGQSGFELQVANIFQSLFKETTVLNFESLPWACRIREYGKAVDVLGTKEKLVGAICEGSYTSIPPEVILDKIQHVVGKSPLLITKGHPIGITLMSTNALIHTSIMYGRWHDWDGNPLREVPLFYQGIDSDSAQLLSDISQESVNIAREIMSRNSDTDLGNVSCIYDWYLRCYHEDISDKTSLRSAILTNRSYDGLVHPMITTSIGKYVPNFTYRYLSEDIPFGLVVMRGIAEIIGVSTPNIDRIIYWAQDITGKEYLVNGSLKGRDMGLTRAPQTYGINSLTTLLET